MPQPSITIDKFTASKEIVPPSDFPRLAGHPIAAGLLVHHCGWTKIPSASSLREYDHASASMLMYRKHLSRVIKRGSHALDFG